MNVKYYKWTAVILVVAGLGFWAFWEPTPAHADKTFKDIVEGFTVQPLFESREKAQEEFKKLKTIKKQMLGVEVDEFKRVELRMVDIVTYLKTPQYKRIDMSFLRWRNGYIKYRRPDRSDIITSDWFPWKIPRPRFGIFTLDSPDCRIDEEEERNLFGLGEESREALAPYFEDVVEALGNIGFATDYSIHSRFQGVIPQDVRNIIAEAEKEFHQILIVAEAGDWGVKKTDVPIRAGDPLVIGRWNDSFWLITYFDLTDIEKTVLKTHVEPTEHVEQQTGEKRP